MVVEYLGNTTVSSGNIPSTEQNNEQLFRNACFYQKADHLEIRFPLFVIFMPAISIIGVIGNVFSIATFSQKELRNANNFYLCFLGGCNIGVLVTANMTYSVEYAYDSLEDFQVYQVWLKYLSIVYFLSNALQTCSIYFTIAATVERWYTSRFLRNVSSRAAKWSVVFVFTSCFGINFVRMFEFYVVHKPLCSGFESYMINLAEFAKTERYQKFTFWLWTCVSVLIPFSFLTIMNIIVIQKFHQIDVLHARRNNIRWATRCSSNNSVEERYNWKRRTQIRAKQREATILLICVVSLFLICNLPGFLLTLMETVAVKFLDAHRTFYSFARDTINFLAIIDSSSGFFLYVIFGQEFRKMSMLMVFKLAGIEPAFNLIKGISEIKDVSSCGIRISQDHISAIDDDDESACSVYYV